MFPSIPSWFLVQFHVSGNLQVQNNYSKPWAGPLEVIGTILSQTVMSRIGRPSKHLCFSFLFPNFAIIRENLTILPSSMEQKLFEGAWFVDILIGQKRARWVGASSTQWRWKLGIRDFLLNFVSQAIFNPRKIILVHNKSTRVHGDNFVLPCNVKSRKP